LPVPDTADLALIEMAARDAGEIARSYFGGTYRRWDKGKGHPVTEADLAVDKFLRETLTGARAGYGWLSEESIDTAERQGTDKTFVVDPIDGTIAFLKGRPHFTISIAIVENGRPVCGVVLNPITNECFDASAGRGATLNGAPIRVSDCGRVEGCRMLAAKSLFDHPGWAVPPLCPWPSMQVEQRNSIAYRLALVAAGQFDATLALSSKHDWDLAAGDLIVHEAGGLVTDHRGAILRYNAPMPIQRSMVGAGQRLHSLLVDRTRLVKLPEH
jgi:myo-inositol-1(or 4)-monophosphatase